ncbi:MAG TPA: hypothetical protein VFT48_00825 [Pyrinomonadaceae bacterium]|nr:hypothetical protein [Pyrinomonadaceae bacterium]
MRGKKLSKRWAFILTAVMTLSLISMGPLSSAACATGAKTSSNTSARPSPASMANNVVLEWNELAVRFALQPVPALAPIQQTRAMAIFQLAMHDAINGITGQYETYLETPPPPENASPEAAAIGAAHEILKNLFPGNDALLDGRLMTSLQQHGSSTADPAVPYGRSVATSILAVRADDRSAEAQFNYDAPNQGQPGVWVRLTSAPASLPGWGKVTPFVLRSASQFQPEAPPDLSSELYAKDYNEIKTIGVATGSTRSPEQSNIALFWRASPTAIWNSVLTQVVQTRNMELSDEARLFALFYLAAADASIACWKVKYEHNFWRPQSAIVNGNSDGNDLTTGNVDWKPFITTPVHPEYPSGHSTNSSAMAKILALEFGDAPGVSISVTQTGITRNWTSFSEAVQEVIDARVYSGIHFRNSDEVGARMGRQIAQFVSHHALRRNSKAK